jgi:hypothetical protein
VDFDGNYHGLNRPEIEAVFRGADCFVEHLRVCEWVEEAAHCRLRVMVDGEPGWTQIQRELHKQNGTPVPYFDRYYTVGLNIGTSAAMAPDADQAWGTLLDPVVTDLFSTSFLPSSGAYTTVMSWQAQGALVYQNRVYGMKDLEFAKFFDLPKHVPVEMEIAVAGKNTPTKELLAAGWKVADAHQVTTTFDGWYSYIAASRGEFSVAKNVFVATNSGFFSDRSAFYLSLARPVVMQETGFSAHLPCGRGLFAVRTVEEAADAIREIEGNYAAHARAAREIAVEYLDSKVVLGRFLRELGV